GRFSPRAADAGRARGRPAATGEREHSGGARELTQPAGGLGKRAGVAGEVGRRVDGGRARVAIVGVVQRREGGGGQLPGDVAEGVHRGEVDRVGSRGGHEVRREERVGGGEVGRDVRAARLLLERGRCDEQEVVGRRGRREIVWKHVRVCGGRQVVAREQVFEVCVVEELHELDGTVRVRVDLGDLPQVESGRR